MNQTRTSSILLTLGALFGFLVAATPAFALIDFTQATVINCGDTVNDDTTGGSNDETFYGSLIPYTAPELVYSFTLNSPGSFTITATGDPGLVLFVLDGPSAGALATGQQGNNPLNLNPILAESATYSNVGPGTFYLVVDGLLGPGAFEFTLDCGGSLDCSSARQVSCGQTINSDTNLGSNTIGNYPCLTGLNSSRGGKEQIYELTIQSQTDLVVDVVNTIFGGSGLIPVGTAFLLDACDPAACLEYADILPVLGGTLNFAGIQPGTYYLVIDAPQGVTFQYSMTVSCVSFDCAAAQDVPCGTRILATNRNLPNQTRDYACVSNPLFDWQGGESLYSITTTQQGDIYVDIRNVSLPTILDTMAVLLLDACSINACQSFATVQDGSSGIVTLRNVPPGTYYLVVDTTNQSGGTCELDVYCGAPGDPANVDIQTVDGRLFPQVEVETKVTDRLGTFVSGLTEQDFNVTEDTVPQTIQVEELECGTGVELSVALVIDTSISMDGQAIIDARNAATEFINLLNPADRAAIITFDVGTSVLQGFTDNKTLLRNTIAGIQATGSSTAVYDGIYRGIDELLGEQNTRIVICLTDGEDNNSSRTPTECILHANANGATVYNIGLGSNVSTAELTRIAVNTGGTFTTAPRPQDLAQIYNNIFRNLKAYYLVRYTSTNPVADATTRNVDVCVAQACDDDTYVANESCLVIGNFQNAVTPAIYEASNTETVGQRFFNASFNGTPGAPGFPNDLEVELFFENTTPGEVRVSWWSDNAATGGIGSKVADADGGAVNIECPGWYGFTFQNAAPNISLQPGNYYWIVVEYAGGDASPLRYNVSGPQGGVATRSGSSWSPVNENHDLFFRVLTCVDNIATPTPTPTITPTPQGTPTITPTPTCAPDPPAIVDIFPQPHSVDVPQGTQLRLSLTDNPGIDRSSVKLFLNGVLQPLTLQGPDTDLVAIFTPSQPYPTDNRVSVLWQYCDTCATQNCGKGLVYSLSFSDTVPTFTPVPATATPTPGGGTPTSTPAPGTPTATPAPNTPTPMPNTPTPTPPSIGPFVGLAGFANTDLDSQNGGNLSVLAMGLFTGTETVLRGELLFQGTNLGINLPVTEVNPGNVILYLDIPLGPTPPVTFDLQLETVDVQNRRSSTWPYLNVEP